MHWRAWAIVSALVCHHAEYTTGGLSGGATDVKVSTTSTRNVRLKPIVSAASALNNTTHVPVNLRSPDASTV